MANETTATTITELIRTEAIGAAALWFEANPGVASFVTQADITGIPTNTHVFPIIDQMTAAAIAENTDFTTNAAIDTSGSASATVTEHIVKSTVTDYARMASTENLEAVASEGSNIGGMFARAMQKLQDQDITALFAAFNSSTGSNSGPLTAALLTEAVSTLNENNIPDDRRVMVLHPTQFRPLIAVFDDASTFGRQGQQSLDTGKIGVLYGAQVFQTTSVATATVSSSTVYAGAVMHPTAVGLVVKDGNMFATERDESFRYTEVMLVKKWGEVEYRGGATTSGRGGAGVYFYSNTTN